MSFAESLNVRSGSLLPELVMRRQAPYQFRIGWHPETKWGRLGTPLLAIQEGGRAQVGCVW